MVHFKQTAAGVTLAVLMTACAGLTFAPVQFTDGIMTNRAGMSLYTHSIKI